MHPFISIGRKTCIDSNTRKVLIEKFGIKQIIILIEDEFEKMSNEFRAYTDDNEAKNDLYDRIENIINRIGKPFNIEIIRFSENKLDIVFKPVKINNCTINLRSYKIDEHGFGEELE